jgi:hypothetical protein
MLRGILPLISLMILASCASYCQNDAEKLFPVESNGEWGYINNRGKMVLEPKFTSGSDFVNGIAIVEAYDKESNKIGQTYINTKGELLAPLGHYKVYPFSCGLARVEYPEEEGEGAVNFIDGHGNLFRESWFKKATDFIQGYAWVFQGVEWRVIDTLGDVHPFWWVTAAGDTLLSRYTEDSPGGSFSEGLATLRRGQTCGFFDMTGKLVIDVTFDDCRAFSDGLAAVSVSDNWGFIDKSGKMVVRPRFQEVQDFFHGGANVKIAERWGRIDKDGRYLIQPIYNFIGSVSDGVVLVTKASREGTKSGYVRANGKMIAEVKYDVARMFSEGYAGTAVAGAKSRSILYIDTLGVVRIKSQFDSFGDFHEGKAIVGMHDKKTNAMLYGYIRKDGSLLIKPQFHEASDYSNGIARVRVNQEWGYVNSAGRIIVNPQFETVENFQDGLGRVRVNGAIGYVNERGAFIWKPTR